MHLPYEFCRRLAYLQLPIHPCSRTSLALHAFLPSALSMSLLQYLDSWHSLQTVGACWGEQAADAPAGGRTERLWWLCAALAELLQGVLLDTSSGSTMMAVCWGCITALPFSSLQYNHLVRRNAQVGYLLGSQPIPSCPHFSAMHVPVPYCSACVSGHLIEVSLL